MRRTRQLRKRPGYHLVTCELSGFVFWSDEVLKTWDGKIVGKPFFENRHPQDFVRGSKDDQQVRDARPEPADVFVDVYPNHVTSDDL